MKKGMMDSNRHSGKKRAYPIPVLPPRIPTPMPSINNNNMPKSSRTREQHTTRVHPSSVALDVPQLISKDSYKLLDNDVKTAWINPRLISKIDVMKVVNTADYELSSRQTTPTTGGMTSASSAKNMNGYYNHNLMMMSHQQQQQQQQQHQHQHQQRHQLYHQQQGCGRIHEREWESSAVVVNGRATTTSAKPSRFVVAVPTLTQAVEDAKRTIGADRSNLSDAIARGYQQQHQQQQQLQHWRSASSDSANRNSDPAARQPPGSSTFKPAHSRSHQHHHMESTPSASFSDRHHPRSSSSGSYKTNGPPIPPFNQSKTNRQQQHAGVTGRNPQRTSSAPPSQSSTPPGLSHTVEVQKVKGLVGYHHHHQQQQQQQHHHHHQSGRMDYVSGSGYVQQGHELVGGGGGVSVGSVFGMYSETRYAFSVNGLPGNPAQASAAAAFFARAAQKLNLSSSPHRRKRHNSDDAFESASGFCGILQKSPPPVPPALLRRIGVKEITGIGKVKVMLRVSTPPGNSIPADTSSQAGSSNNFFSLDKRKKQVTLVDPSTCGGASAAPEDRRVGVAAPKMFAFDAIFSQDDSQTEVCSSALTDVIHAVINGTDGCLFCFGHAGLGKSYTMLGTPENANTLGIIPCAISWLFRGINEQKQRTGARFSVRVSAVEVCGSTNQLRDLLAGYSNDCEQSPGVYLRDNPLLNNQPPHCELRVPTAERAAHYLDVAVEGRAPTREDSRDSHLLFTLHVYQYSVAGKGGVAGGRSRLHLFDLGNSERGKSSGGIPLSGLGNILLAIFNGQKHLPYKEHKLTHLLKDCLNSLTCHAAMIAHVSSYAQNYSDTLTTVQLASRIHRMRRRRIKFVSAGVGNGSGGSSGEEATRTTGTSSEPDPSSSDLSADTVIYIGPVDDATDGEHPPVYIPSLNSGDNRCSMSKALRGSTAEHRTTKVPVLQRPTTTSSPAAEEKTPTHRAVIKAATSQSNKTSPVHSSNTPKSSPGRIPSIKNKTQSAEGTNASKQHTGINGGSDEHWIDGPRISKSKVAEARHLMKEPCHVKKRETWIDGPMQADASAAAAAAAYGYMDSHKKNMIRKWVEHQTSQIQRKQIKINQDQHQPQRPGVRDPPTFKELTQFKTCEDVKNDSVEESVIRTGLKLASNRSNSDAIPECETPEDKCEEEEDDEETVEIPPALPLIQPLSSREVSLESLDNLLKERLMNGGNTNFCSNQDDIEERMPSDDDDDEILEIIEVEEPLEPVPTQDCCLQVTEEDIALCMGFLENPLPEVDQENPLDHPLRILSQENLTVVSTFTDSMSVYTDLERILPRHRYDPKYGIYNDDYEDPDNPFQKVAQFTEDPSQQKFNQLARLHELYSNRLAKANVTNSELYQQNKINNENVLTRTESLSLSDALFGMNGFETSSIYSEPAYVPNDEKFCHNCKVSMSRPATAQHWYDDAYLSISTGELTAPVFTAPPISRRFQRYCHKYTKEGSSNLSHLRHPDGASNPNLKEESDKIAGNETLSNRNLNSIAGLSDEPKPVITRPITPPNSLPSTERINRKMMSIEAGLTSIKLIQKQSDEYDSGHDSTPRTSKHSPAAISRRAESGYDSVVRDSESSSIDSDTSRLSHLHHNRRGKCKHKHDKSFCSWFLHPFTCKYIDEPPETHF